MKNAIIYTTKTCRYCKDVEKLFNDHGVKYEKFDVGVDLERRKEMVEKSGQLGVPVIDIAGDIVIGYDEDTLKQLLAIS